MTDDDQPVGPKAKSPRLQPDELISVPDGLPASFQLPQHFGRKIDVALRVGEADNKIRNAVVRTVATCVRAVVERPTAIICEYLARRLVKKYPCLGEKDPRDYLKTAGVKVTDKGKPFKNWVRSAKEYALVISQIYTADFFVQIEYGFSFQSGVYALNTVSILHS